MSEANLTDREKIIKNIVWSIKKPLVLGGQHCGVMRRDVTLTSEEIAFEITIGYHRSQIKNRELAYSLFLLALDEVIK